MNPVWGVFAAACFLVGALAWCRVLRPGKTPAQAAFFFAFLTAQILAAGFALSTVNRLASSFAWAVAGLFLAAPAVTAERVWRPSPEPSDSRRMAAWKSWWQGLPLLERKVLATVLVTVAAVGLLNAAVVLFSAPHTWDNLAYRLARMAYYLQHGNLGYFDANYVQQVAVQRNCSILMLFVLVASGRNENLAQFWQFFAYWTSAACVFGISREIGLKRSAALLASGIFALLTVCLMQATTAQSDMLLAACAGCSVYSLLAWRNRPRVAFLFVAALGIGLGFGIKGSFTLFIPSFLLIWVYAFGGGRPGLRLRGMVFFGIFALLAAAVFALPSAYLSNWRLFNNPMGPEEFRRVNSYEGKPVPFILGAGGKHLMRHGFDFLTLDGLPALPWVWKAQNALRYPARALTRATGIDLEKDLAHPWFYFPPPHSHEDYSSWGILGWSLVWPALLWAVVGVRQRRGPGLLALSALVFIVVHAFSGVYDFGGRARYLLPAAVLAAPAAGWWFYFRSRALKIWLIVFAALGCLSAVTAVLFRYRSPVWFDQSVFFRGRLTPAQAEAWPLPARMDSIFLRDRMSQVLRDAPIFEEAIRNYERVVPPGARVAAALNPNSVEYLLFGPRLTRRIYPLNSFHRGLQPIPPEADYLLWTDDFDEIFNRGEGDIHLGKDWWLRRLR